MEPVKHPKGWGYELWIVNNKNYCGKILHFNKDKKCSWHYHKLKHETFYVQQGTIELLHGWNDDINKAEKIILEQGTLTLPILEKRVNNYIQKNSHGYIF